MKIGDKVNFLNKTRGLVAEEMIRFHNVDVVKDCYGIIIKNTNHEAYYLCDIFMEINGKMIGLEGGWEFSKSDLIPHHSLHKHNKYEIEE
jgi:hypothetical protein